MPALVQSSCSAACPSLCQEVPSLTGREGDMYMHSIVLHTLESPLLECLSLKTTRGQLKLLRIAKAKKHFKYSKKMPSFKKSQRKGCCPLLPRGALPLHPRWRAPHTPTMSPPPCGEKISCINTNQMSLAAEIRCPFHIVPVQWWEDILESYWQ